MDEHHGADMINVFHIKNCSEHCTPSRGDSLFSLFNIFKRLYIYVTSILCTHLSPICLPHVVSIFFSLLVCWCTKTWLILILEVPKYLQNYSKSYLKKGMRYFTSHIPESVEWGEMSVLYGVEAKVEQRGHVSWIHTFWCPLIY